MPEMAGGANPLSIGYTAQVFTGQAKWNAAAGGAWRVDANWADAGSSATAGAPGVSGLAGVYDTATFNAPPPQSGDPGSPSPAQMIDLDGATPYLAALVFDGPAKYMIAPGAGGGALHAANGAGTATITVSSGSHSIAAPLIIDSDTNIAGGGALVDGGDIATAAHTLTIGTSVEAGHISGNGVTQVNGSLTADSLVQNSLVIGAGGSVTIRETTGAAGSASAVPEPCTWVLACTALLGWLIFRRRNRR